MRRIAFAVLSCFVALSSVAQAPRIIEEPRTELEALAAKVNVVVVKGSTRIGEIKGGRGGSIVVEAREATEVSSGTRAAGLSIEVGPPSDTQIRHVIYLDDDEVPMLLNAIDYLAKITPSCTSLDNYQASYRTRGGLELSLASIRIGEGVRLSAIDTANTIYSVFLRPQDLSQLKDFVVAAMEKLEGKRK